ncbi:MAG: hypothetical protein AAB879_02845 [Patescibacteria group bacterium]
MKLELTLTKDVQRRVAKNAQRFGMDIPGYVYFVVAQETRQMTPRMMQKVRCALKTYKAGKTIRAGSIAELLGKRSVT